MRVSSNFVRVVALTALLTALATGVALAALHGGKAGKPDRSFSMDGQVSAYIDDGFQRPATDIAVDSHDRPVLVGSIYYAFATARFHENGQLDHSFRKTGIAELHFGRQRAAFANAVAIDRRDRIVVAGGTDGGRSEDSPKTDELALARYKTNGRLDESFAGDGTRAMKLASSGPETIEGVQIDDRGRIDALADVDGRPTLVRYHPSGRIDRSFGHRGTTRLPPTIEAFGLAIDHHGVLYVATKRPSDGAEVVAIDSHGLRLHGFGNSGRARVPIDRALSIAASAGRIAVAGDKNGRIAVAALQKSGKLDHRFSHNGVDTAPLIGEDDYSQADSVAIDHHQRIVALGSTIHHISDPDSERIALAEFGRQGGLDRRFSGDGISVAKLKRSNGKPLKYSAPTAVTIDGRDRILAAAHNDQGGGDSGPFYALRYHGR